MQKARGLALVPSRKLQLWTPLEREDNCFLQQKLIKEGQFSSVAQSCPTVYNPMNRSTPGLPIHHQLPESIQTHVHWVGDAIQPSQPLSSLLLLSSILPSIRGFSSESDLPIKWSKYWSSSFSISPSNEYSRLISFKIEWFELLAVQETPKSLIQRYSLKASILWCSALFMVQFSHPYMTTRKTKVLNLWLP